MNKKQQIMQLVREWQKEDEENRIVVITLMEVVNKKEDSYDTHCSGATIGKTGYLIDYFESAFHDKRYMLHKFLNYALKKYTANRFVAFTDLISNGDDE